MERKSDSLGNIYGDSLNIEGWGGEIKDGSKVSTLGNWVGMW